MATGAAIPGSITSAGFPDLPSIISRCGSGPIGEKKTASPSRQAGCGGDRRKERRQHREHAAGGAVTEEAVEAADQAHGVGFLAWRPVAHGPRLPEPAAAGCNNRPLRLFSPCLGWIRGET